VRLPPPSVSIKYSAVTCTIRLEQLRENLETIIKTFASSNQSTTKEFHNFRHMSLFALQGHVLRATCPPTHSQPLNRVALCKWLGRWRGAIWWCPRAGDWRHWPITDVGSNGRVECTRGTARTVVMEMSGYAQVYIRKVPCKNFCAF
jgi:hypothetical protein